MARDPAKSQLKPDSGRNFRRGDIVGYLDRKEADVVGVAERCDRSTTVKRDVEFSGQSKQLAMIEQVPVKVFGKR